MTHKGQKYNYSQYRLTQRGLQVCNSVDRSDYQRWVQLILREKKSMAYNYCNASVVGFPMESYTIYNNFTVFFPTTKQLITRQDYGVVAGHFAICSTKLSLSCNDYLVTVTSGKVWRNFSLSYNNKMYDYDEYRFSHDNLEMCLSSDSRVQTIWKYKNRWDKFIGAFRCIFIGGTIMEIRLNGSKQSTLYFSRSVQQFEKHEYILQHPGTIFFCDKLLKPETLEFTKDDMSVCCDSVFRIGYDDDYKVLKDFSLLYKAKTYYYTEYRVLKDSIKICNSTSNIVRNIWNHRNFWVKMSMHYKSCNTPIFYYALEQKEYTVLKDFRVFIFAKKQLIQRFDYGVAYSKLLICVEKIAAGSLHYLRARLIMIAPFCALGLSTISLLLLLAVYFMLPELRTLPGLNLMSLSFAYLLWLTSHIILNSLHLRVGTLLNLPCATISITETSITYCILSNAAVNVYHLKKTFSRNVLVRSDVNKFKTFLKYCIFSWGSPIMITIGYIILVKTEVFRFYQTVKINTHKKVEICQDHNIPAWLVSVMAYVLPSCFVLYIIVMFIFTAYQIHKKLKASNTIAQKSNLLKTRKSFVLLLKLSTTTAVFWSIPFIVIQHVLYKFDNAISVALLCVMLLNGVYVAVAFVFTRKNYQLFKKKYFPRNAIPA